MLAVDSWFFLLLNSKDHLRPVLNANVVRHVLNANVARHVLNANVVKEREIMKINTLKYFLELVR